MTGYTSSGPLGRRSSSIRIPGAAAQILNRVAGRGTTVQSGSENKHDRLPKDAGLLDKGVGRIEPQLLLSFFGS